MRETSPQARAASAEALDLARRLGMRGYEAYALRVRGEAWRLASVWQAAAAAYASGLDIAESLGMRPLVAHCHLGLAKLTGAQASAMRPRSTSPPRRRCTARWTCGSGWRRREAETRGSDGERKQRRRRRGPPDPRRPLRAWSDCRRRQGPGPAPRRLQEADHGPRSCRRPNGGSRRARSRSTASRFLRHVLQLGLSAGFTVRRVSARSARRSAQPAAALARAAGEGDHRANAIR